MHFAFTEEQDLLRHEVRKLLEQQCPMPEVRRWMATPDGFSGELWKRLGELGWLGLMIPERFGGAGLGWTDAIIVLEETGRGLLPSPLVSTTLAAATILDAGTDGQQRRLLPGLADGSRTATLAILDDDDHLAAGSLRRRGEPDGAGFVLTGRKTFVADPTSADCYVVAFRTGDSAEELTLGLIDAGAEGVRAQAFPTMDATKRVGNLVLDGARIGPDAVLGEVGAAWPAISCLLDRGAVAVAAEMIGAAQALLDLTVQYAKQRVQFGSPIGHFQGVKHPLAEIHMQIDSSRSLLWYAAWALDASPAEAPRAASLCKAFATEAFNRIGIDAIQFHGAYGTTEDCDVHLYYKRSKWARATFGDADYHYERIARLRGL
ncbi:MAG: acyl-CoA dehydrogenase family protein [Myxococcota bacterium]|nr:acyl-CoA dehydrogenase family protein [Myxococcota bacterium]